MSSLSVTSESSEDAAVDFTDLPDSSLERVLLHLDSLRDSLHASQSCKRLRSVLRESRQMWRAVELALPERLTHAAAVRRLRGCAAWVTALDLPIQCFRLNASDCRELSLTGAWPSIVGLLHAMAPALRRLSLRLRLGHLQLHTWLLPLQQLEFLEVGFTWSDGSLTVEAPAAQLPRLRCLHIRQASLSASPAAFPTALTELLLEEYTTEHAVPEAALASAGSLQRLVLQGRLRPRVFAAGAPARHWAALSALRGLTQLSLPLNEQAELPRELSLLTGLQSLSVYSWCKEPLCLELLNELPQLTALRLDLNCSRGVGGAMPAPVQCLRRLRRLEVRSAAVTAALEWARQGAFGESARLEALCVGDAAWSQQSSVMAILPYLGLEGAEHMRFTEQLVSLPHFTELSGAEKGSFLASRFLHDKRPGQQLTEASGWKAPGLDCSVWEQQQAGSGGSPGGVLHIS